MCGIQNNEFRCDIFIHAHYYVEATFSCPSLSFPLVPSSCQQNHVQTAWKTSIKYLGVNVTKEAKWSSAKIYLEVK